MAAIPKAKTMYHMPPYGGSARLTGADTSLTVSARFTCRWWWNPTGGKVS